MSERTTKSPDAGCMKSSAICSNEIHGREPGGFKENSSDAGLTT